MSLDRGGGPESSKSSRFSTRFHLTKSIRIPHLHAAIFPHPAIRIGNFGSHRSVAPVSPRLTLSRSSARPRSVATVSPQLTLSRPETFMGAAAGRARSDAAAPSLRGSLIG